MRPATPAILLAAVLASCGAEPESGSSPDAAAQLPADASVPVEVEPNDGSTDTEFNELAIPGEVAGKVDPANDIDIFGVEPTPGELLTWELRPTSAALAPSLTIFEAAGKMPSLVSNASPGAVAEQEQFTLSGGRWFVGVRDARNVPDPTGKGGKDFGWHLSVRRTPRAPDPLPFPGTVRGTLRHGRAIALYAFQGNRSFAFDIDLRAERKSPASDMDSQLSLFDMTTRRWVHTNDDSSGQTTDSHIGGDGLPSAGEYVLVVENLAPRAEDLSFELVTALRE